LRKSKKLGAVLLVIIALVVGTIVAVFVGYRRVQNAPEMLLSSIKDGADLSLGKIKQTATRDGRKEWSLEAGSALYMENEKKAVLKDLAVTYYFEDGREVYLDADQGILHTDTNDIEFSGNVVIRNGDYRMATDRLNYEHGPRFIFCNQPVQITGNGAKVTGNSLNFDLNANKVVLSGDVAAALPGHFRLQQQPAAANGSAAGAIPE
jgi:LPS export ABC transporter protein LptC